MLIPRLPPTITQLIFVFLVATPLLAQASPVDDTALSNDATPALLPVKAATPAQPAAKRAPTRRMGARKVKKSEPLKKKDYSSFLCPGGSVACPVYFDGDEVTAESIAELDGKLSSLADWFKVGFECMELDSELNSCGGCLALGAGQDCSTITNARATGCEKGVCAVYSCFEGYVVSPDRSACVKKGTATPATPITAVNADSDQYVLR